jgi:hypothetical protein
MFENIGKTLTQAYEQIKTPQANPITVLQQDINDIKAALKHLSNNTTKTWAQVAAVQPNTQSKLPPEVQAAQQERQKSEVTLSTRAVGNDTKEALNKMNDQQLTEHLKNLSGNKAIVAARRTTKQTIKVRCQTHEHAKELSNAPWNSYITGLSTIKPTFSIVIHGASKQDVNLEDGTASDDTMREIETTNLKRFTINKITPLRKHQRNPEAPTQSIIIQLSSPQEANECIHNGIYIGRRLYPTEKYMPQYQIKQCYSCQRYGHIAQECTRKPTCGKCGQEHTTKECTTKKPKCSHCTAEQPSWHQECPARKQETARLELLKRQQPPFFST